MPLVRARWAALSTEVVREVVTVPGATVLLFDLPRVTGPGEGSMRQGTAQRSRISISHNSEIFETT
jgi:hypothetical protein